MFDMLYAEEKMTRSSQPAEFTGAFGIVLGQSSTLSLTPSSSASRGMTEEFIGSE